MKRHVCVACILLLAFYAGPVVAQEEIQEIQVVTMEWPGATNADGTGIYFEVLKAVYEPLGIRMEFQFTPFKRAIKMTEEHKVDALVCGYKSTPKPGGYAYLFPEWHLDVEEVFVIFKRETFTSWTGPETLAGSKVGWQRGYDAYKNSLTVDVTMVEFDRMKKGLELLNIGRIDAVLGYKIDFKTYAEEIEDMELDAYQIEAMFFGKKLYLKFANTERSQALVNIFDERMDALATSGELQPIYEKWDKTFVLKE